MATLPAEVLTAFQVGQFAICQKAGVFNATVICDSKSSGNIVGLTCKDQALLQWMLTRKPVREYARAMEIRSGTDTPIRDDHEQTLP